jgi:hypothetical protein
MLRAGFVVIFGCLTLFPLVQSLTRLLPEKSLTENRVLAQWPAKFETSHDYVKKIGHWFNDNFGFRGLLISVKHQVDYSVFNFSERVHIGSNQWLFYRSVIDVERPNVENVLASNLDGVQRGIVALAGAFERNGIRMIFLVNEMSDRFYPDMVPSSALPTPPDTRIRRLVRALKSSEVPSVVDATAILAEAAKVRHVFHKTDFHWNDPAAFVVAERIVAMISETEGRPASVWSHPLQVRTDRFSGGIANFMPLLWSPREDGLMVAQNWAFPAGFRQSGARGIFEYSLHIPNSDGSLLGPTVIVGDSFSDGFIRSGIYMSFSDYYGVRWGRMRKLSALARELPLETKYVVVQFIEVQLTALLAFADKDDIALAAETIDTRFNGRMQTRTAPGAGQ